MGEKLLTSVITVISAIIAVAIIAILVSRQSHTADVLKAGGDAFSNILKAAFGGAYGVGVNNFTTLPTITIR